MAAVSVNIGAPRPDASVHTTPRDRWLQLAMARRRWAEIDLPHDCRLLKVVVDEAPVMAAELGHPSAEAFLTDYLGLDLDLVHRVIGWLEREQPAEAVTLAAAVEAAKVQPLGEPDQGGPGRGHKSPDDVRPLGQDYGNSQAYLLRRIARDQPELLEQIGPDKEHRSARSAAIAAGIIKPVPVLRITTPEAIAVRLRQHLTGEQIHRLVEQLLAD